MGESQELYAAVNYVKHKVEAIEKIEMLNLRSNKVLRDEYISILQSDALLFSVYKEVDGIKSQKKIAIAVNTTEMSVSRKVKKLSEIGLIEIKETASGECIYKYTVAEQAFKLTRI